MNTYHVWQPGHAVPLEIRADSIRAPEDGSLQFLCDMPASSHPMMDHLRKIEVVESFAPNQWSRWKIIRDDADTPD